MRTPDEISITDDDLTVEEAARLAGVDREVVRQWVRRGHLQVASRDPAGWRRFRALDVAKAERATRARARRS